MFFLPFQLSLSKEITRLPNGKPSSIYWQQRVDYNVKAELIPERNILNGKGTITYYNNSPDTLRTLVWHLYQNIFRKDSSPRKNNEQGGRAFEITNGITIDRIAIDGTAIFPKIDETIMETTLQKPLLPHTISEITIEWNYDIPKTPFLRTGSSGKDFAMCQWYPQIAVYDDQHGWDKEQYLGYEFYLEYGNWNVEITVPNNYIVAATGTLQNAKEVLTTGQLNRLNSLIKDSITKIILPSEVGINRDTANCASRTWIFSAESVRDFALAASPEFVWDVQKLLMGVIFMHFIKQKSTGHHFRSS